MTLHHYTTKPTRLSVPGFHMVGLGDDLSDLDIGLPAGTDDAAYMEALEGHLPNVMESFQPDLVLYDAG